MLNIILSQVIFVLHACLLAFIVLTPLLDITGAVDMPIELLLLHSMACCMILIHWACNNSACFLTILETKLRGLEKCEESFMHALVSPVYEYNATHETYIANRLLVLVMAYSMGRIVRRRQELDKYKNLFLTYIGKW